MVDSHKQGVLNAGSLFSCDGLVALVTGGGTGIGYMISNALLQNGAKTVYISGRRPDTLARAASALGPRAVPLACDVTSPPSLEAAAAQVAASAGHLDLLVCNAGVGGPQVAAPAGESTSLEDWAAANLAHGFAEYARTFEVNTAAVWYTVMAFLPLLGRGNGVGLGSVGGRQSSQVVVTGSIAGFNKMAPGGYAYGQSKAAVNQLVKQLAVVLPKWNIRINSICPGLFPSEMSAPVVNLYTPTTTPADPSQTTISLPSKIVPLQRMGDEEDMAGAILYLASRAGAYCNGNVLVVDGGRLGNFPTAS